jgi:uncharacterized protein YndB with AHSA1/START domain
MDEQQIRHSVYIAASPARVYDAFATADGLNGWFCHGASIDLVNHVIRLRWERWSDQDLSGSEEGPILAADRPHRFSFQWGPHRTTVSLSFEPMAGGTRVIVEENGYDPAIPAEFARLMDCASGWGEVLALGKAYVETGYVYRHPWPWK